MENFKKQYRDLEQRVYSELRNLIENSDTDSSIINEKCIKVNLFDYIELTIINDRLVFLDSNGFEYNIYTDTSLEDLIDILTLNNK
jgi:hypothetical protein